MLLSKTLMPGSVYGPLYNHGPVYNVYALCTALFYGPI